MNPTPGHLPLGPRHAANSPRRPRPLSYEDLRRFLFLLLGLALTALLIRAISDILILFTVVFFLAMVLNPIVSWLEKRGLRRGLSVLLVMLGLVGTIVGLGFLVVPPLVEQVSGLVSKAPTYSEGIERQMKGLIERFPALQGALPAEYKGKNLENFGETIGKKVAPQLLAFAKNMGPNVGNRVLALSTALVGGLFTFVIALLMLAFILGNPQPLISGFLGVVPHRHRDTAGRCLARIENQMLAWMRATLINGILTGASTFALLYFIGLPSAIVFGVLSFFGEFVPNIGPIVASAPALFVAAGLGTNKLLWTGAAILFVQQVESNLLVPFVMGKQMELHPVTIVFFALAMGAVFGVAGAILAVPLAAITKVLVDEFIYKPNAVPLDELDKQAAILVSERRWSDPTEEATETEATNNAEEEANAEKPHIVEINSR